MSEHENLAALRSQRGCAWCGNPAIADITRHDGEGQDGPACAECLNGFQINDDPKPRIHYMELPSQNVTETLLDIIAVLREGLEVERATHAEWVGWGKDAARVAEVLAEADELAERLSDG